MEVEHRRVREAWSWRRSITAASPVYIADTPTTSSKRAWRPRVRALGEQLHMNRRVRAPACVYVLGNNYMAVWPATGVGTVGRGLQPQCMAGIRGQDDVVGDGYRMRACSMRTRAAATRWMDACERTLLYFIRKSRT